MIIKQSLVLFIYFYDTLNFPTVQFLPERPGIVSLFKLIFFSFFKHILSCCLCYVYFYVVVVVVAIEIPHMAYI